MVSAEKVVSIDNLDTIKETYFVYDSLVSESNVPQTKTHVSVEPKIYPPAHPADVLLVAIDSKPQSRKRNRTWTRKVVQIALRPGASSGTPRKVRVRSGQRGTLERAVVKCLQERLGGIEYLVVIHELDSSVS